MISLLMLIGCLQSTESKINNTDTGFNIAPVVNSIDVSLQITFDSTIFGDDPESCEKYNYQHDYKILESLVYDIEDIKVYVEDLNGVDDVESVVLVKIFDNETESIHGIDKAQYWTFYPTSVRFDYGIKYDPVICVTDFGEEQSCYDPTDREDIIFSYKVICI